jgi:phospholipase/lecithinase/hemolysin
MSAHEAGNASLAGQLRDVSIQIHPINTFQFQDDMFALKLGNTFA